jgi:hypothetical protein
MGDTTLIAGPYEAPRLGYGTIVTCLRRDREVEIVGMTDAPIAWPVGRTIARPRRRGIILFGALADAVRTESSQSVAHWWGVSVHTVTGWRRALDVGFFTPGTVRLRDAIHPSAVEAARSVEARAARGERLRGRAKSDGGARSIAAIRATIGRKRSAAPGGRLPSNNPDTPAYTDEEYALLIGPEPNAVVAARTGRSVAGVKCARQRLRRRGVIT